MRVEQLIFLMKKLQYTFSNEQLLRTALTHRSVAADNNERLEFLGDSVLSYVIAAALYEKLPQANEGQLTRLRANLVRKETLAAIADELQLEKYLILGPGELKSGGARRDSIKADAVEAIIGAVELDGGFAAARTLILEIYQQRLQGVSLQDVQKDAKTLLQEHQQKFNLPLPEYKVLSVQGEAHQQQFSVSCQIDGMVTPIIATGSSRRRAEQDAATKVLALVGSN